MRQDGDSVDILQEAIDTCPVDCIHWVKFEELDKLKERMQKQWNPNTLKIKATT